MKKTNRKYVLFFGAVVIALLMVSGAIAVNGTKINEKKEATKNTSYGLVASEDTQNPDTTDTWVLAKIYVSGEGCFYKFGQTFYPATVMIVAPGVTIKVDSGTVKINGDLKSTPCDIHATLFIGYGSCDPFSQRISIRGVGIIVTN